MWFRNLALLRLTAPYRRDPEETAAALAAHAARPCGGLEPSSYGWEPPLGRDGGPLVHAAAGCMLLCACREERLLPAAVIAEAAGERIAELERSEGRPLGRRERKRVQDDVYFDLLPRAFIRRIRTRAYLAPAAGWLVIDAASARRIDDLVALLGRSLPGIALEPYAPPGVGEALTGWLERDRPPDGFALGQACELRDPVDGGAVVRCQRQDLGGEEIRAHLRAGKRVERLALELGGRLSFVLSAELRITRLRFEAVDELDDRDEADPAARLDADFAFMTAELAPLLERLAELFGSG